jgi:hypothetical protein
LKTDLADTLRLFDAGTPRPARKRRRGPYLAGSVYRQMQARSLTRSFEQQGHFSDELDYIRLRKRILQAGFHETLKQFYRVPAALGARLPASGPRGLSMKRWRWADAGRRCGAGNRKPRRFAVKRRGCLLSLYARRRRYMTGRKTAVSNLYRHSLLPTRCYLLFRLPRRI